MVWRYVELTISMSTIVRVGRKVRNGVRVLDRLRSCGTDVILGHVKYIERDTEIRVSARGQLSRPRLSASYTSTMAAIAQQTQSRGGSNTAFNDKVNPKYFMITIHV